MIQINLLEQSQVKGRARRVAGAGASPAPGGGGSNPLGTIVIVLAALLVFCIDGGAGLFLYQKVEAAGEESRQLKTQIKKVDDEIATRFTSSDQVRKFAEVLTNQKEVLATLDPADRLLWSEKINMLAALVPKDVFLSEIAVNEVVELIETAESKEAHAKWEAMNKAKRGAEPEVVKKPVIHYDVMITGLATGRDSVEQFDNILAFHKAMIGYKAQEGDATHAFMDGFVNNVDFGSIEASTYEGVPVNKFVFKLKTLNQGDDKTAAKTAAQTASAEPAAASKTIASAR